MGGITVVGGGIIGVCSALALQEEGFSVEIIDRGKPEESATYGNCGLLAVGEVVPISKPGILTKVPKWLLDPQEPFFVRPKDMIGQLPWLVRFLWSGRRSRVREIAAALSPLLHQAEDDYCALLEKADIADCLVAAENIVAFNSRADYVAEQFTWNLRERHGFKHHFLEPSELQALEPSLGGPITCGALLEGSLQFTEPGLVRQRLADFFVARGGTLRAGSVERIETKAGRATAIHLESGECISVERIVLCAGAWSSKLSKSLGLRTPLAALQGYHNHLPQPGVRLNHAVLYANGGFVMTPMANGLRIGGTIEITGLDSKPDFSRADMITQKASEILPGLDVSGGKKWMGPRPFTPDTMPVLGREPYQTNVILAFGHGQVGMTLGATTGKIVAELMTGRKPSVELAPFSAARFRDDGPEDPRAALIATLASL